MLRVSHTDSSCVTFTRSDIKVSNLKQARLPATDTQSAKEKNCRSQGMQSRKFIWVRKEFWNQLLHNVWKSLKKSHILQHCERSELRFFFQIKQIWIFASFFLFAAFVSSLLYQKTFKVDCFYERDKKFFPLLLFSAFTTVLGQKKEIKSICWIRFCEMFCAMSKGSFLSAFLYRKHERADFTPTD